MYQRKFFEDMQNNGLNLTFFISIHQVLVNQICKDLARININKSINSTYTAPTAKDGRYMNFIDSEYKAQDVTIFDDIDPTSFSSGVLKRI